MQTGKKFILFLLPMLVFSGILVQAQIVNILIDQLKKYQKIEGFGAFNTLSLWKPEPGIDKYDFLVNDMGLTMMRFELMPGFQPKKDSAYDLNATVFSGPDLQHNFADVRALKNLGVKKFIASIWSPPLWMKTPNAKDKIPDTKNGGSLKPDSYEDFAKYCAGYCKIFKEQTGIELFALGLQNEPEFVEPYNSCIYNPLQMREALRYVGRQFAKEKIGTLIILPEALPAQRHIADFINVVNEDPETRNYTTVFAIHNYDSDGMNVGGASAAEWKKYSDLASGGVPPKQLWMTETSGHKNNWDGAMLLAANMYNSLAYGNISAWLWWAITDKRSSEVFGLIIDGKPTGRYYVSKHFYRFIRPGSVRVDASSTDNDLLVLAFTHSDQFKTVILLINKSNTEKKVSLPRRRGRQRFYLSTSNLNCVLQENLNNEKNITLPAQSIATIVWE